AGREVNGGAEPGVYTNTANFDVGRQAKPKAVYAVIAHHVVSGNIQPGSRLLTLADERQPQFVCEVSHRGADIRLACSDGSFAQVRMASSGCGLSTSGEPASLCVGFGANYAARRLVAPPGYALVGDDGALTLKPAG